MSTLIHRRVAECRAGTNPQTICRVNSGWVVLGDVQVLRGYSLLLPDPVVPHLNALSGRERRTLLYEASVLGDALLELTDAIRINYEILGNLEPALHVHVFPRYEDEPPELKTRPVWFYDWAQAPKFDGERDAPLMKDIRAYLESSGIVTPGAPG
jgi:diadenosine tetraphosphate (Ap4A) HIT family hydrolase